MNVGFYAPLKSPNHTVPSGDRAMAQALMRALQDTQADVRLASELRIYDSTGSEQTQAQLQSQATQEIARILPKARAENWRAWVTYHCYYKAPDLIGPAVCDALKIPYILIEATRARKRLDGPWARFAAASEAACDAADTILYLTERDAQALRHDAPEGQSLVHLRPFLNIDTLPPASDHSRDMLCVAMMRAGDKLQSYQLVAQMLALYPEPDWTLDIVGDGPARAEIEAMFAPFGTRVIFHGQADQAGVDHHYSKASLLVWPGVNEAFGMTYLEAQARGVPVLAQNRPGVRDVTPAGQPLPQSGALGLAHALGQLRSPAFDRKALGHKLRAQVLAEHLRPSASNTLRSILQRIERSAP